MSRLARAPAIIGGGPEVDFGRVAPENGEAALVMRLPPFECLDPRTANHPRSQ
jgi:hypothetical protein